MTTNTWISHDGGTTWRCTHRSLFTRKDIESAFLAWITDMRLNPDKYLQGESRGDRPDLPVRDVAKSHTDHLIGLIEQGGACATNPPNA